MKRQNKPKVPHVEIKFSCHLCGLKDYVVYVKPRKEEQDLMNWMEGVKGAIYHVHRQVKPHCKSEQVDLKIHLAKDIKFVGEASG